jgi:hypothetical protein
LRLHDEPLQPIATDFNFAPSTQQPTASRFAGKLPAIKSALPLLADTQRPALPLTYDTQRLALSLTYDTQRLALFRRSDTQQLTFPRRADSDQQSALDNTYQQHGADSHNALRSLWRRRR